MYRSSFCKSIRTGFVEVGSGFVLARKPPSMAAVLRGCGVGDDGERRGRLGIDHRVITRLILIENEGKDGPI